MSTATTVVDALAEAIVAQDLARATALLDPEIDFRAMTPNRIWEPDGPAGVADVLREWTDQRRRRSARLRAAGVRTRARFPDRLDARHLQRLDPAGGIPA